MSFDARMSALVRALELDPAGALTLAEALEADLVAAEVTCPIELGWARDYRIRALYRLGRHDEGLRLVLTPPAKRMTMTAKNAAWILVVIGPRAPMPICTRSSSRIGVTSAAVPVKKASSQM